MAKHIHIFSDESCQDSTNKKESFSYFYSSLILDDLSYKLLDDDLANFISSNNLGELKWTKLSPNAKYKAIYKNFIDIFFNHLNKEKNFIKFRICYLPTSHIKNNLRFGESKEEKYLDIYFKFLMKSINWEKILVDLESFYVINIYLDRLPYKILVKLHKKII